LPGWPALPGVPTPGWGQPQPNQDVAQRCVDDINRYRATKGLTPLARWSSGEACASAESADDSRTRQPHGSFGRCGERAQNACPNWPGPPEKMTDDCLQSMWNEGPGDFPAHGHYMNMADPASREVACGVFTQSDGTLWAVQDFR
jgi:hypothetical protein